MTDQSHRFKLVTDLRDKLAECGWRIVFAESCTAGRVAASLSVLPGISQWLCGGFVVYRCDSKAQWLDVPSALLADPAVGPVSREASRMLAIRALARTPEASVAVAVTGDVGPGAASQTDGRLFCAAQLRHSGLIERSFMLQSSAPVDALDVAARVRRLEEATDCVLAFAQQVVAGEPNR